MQALTPSLFEFLMLIPLGLIVGSFLGVLAIRLPQGQAIALARSQCPHCKHTLTFSDLFPLVSWLALAGRCRYCRETLTVFYPAIEISAVAIAIWAAYFSQGLPLVFSCVLGWLLLALAAMDLRTYRLSDVLVFPLAVLGLCAGAILDRAGFIDHVAGLAAGFGILFLANALYRQLRGRDGMGLGDAKLLGAGGAWVAWQGLASVLIISTFAALLVAVGMRLSGRKLTLTSKLPFGPFIALGIWVVWLHGPLLLWQD